MQTARPDLAPISRLFDTVSGLFAGTDAWARMGPPCEDGALDIVRVAAG